MKVVLASKNPHKLVEIDAITRKLGIELILQSELGVDIDVEETGTTFEENSFLKAYAVMQATGLPAMAITKLDGTAKGGIVIAVSDALQIPVKFVGVGEQADDLMPFVAEDFVKALIGDE